MILYKRDLVDVDWTTLKQTLHDDDFDNGRTPEQLRRSFENSYGVCFAYAEAKTVGTARVLSDGICNAYIVDVWTLSAYRRQGIARQMLETLLNDLHGQHVYLWTDDSVDFYKKIGFVERGFGLEKVIGEWLVNRPSE